MFNFFSLPEFTSDTEWCQGDTKGMGESAIITARSKNLFKMKILPKFTYIFWNSPQWIPNHFLSNLTSSSPPPLFYGAPFYPHKHCNPFCLGALKPRMTWSCSCIPLLKPGRKPGSFEFRSSQVVSPHTPLWLNTNLPHFYALADPHAWTKHRIKWIFNIVGQGHLL